MGESRVVSARILFAEHKYYVGYVSHDLNALQTTRVTMNQLSN